MTVFEITRMENHASVTGWQKLFSKWQKCILGDRLRAALFVLLAEFWQFSSAMPFVYTIIISPLDCFLSCSCVTDAVAIGGGKNPRLKLIMFTQDILLWC